jgi:hypothetical protein
MRNFLIWASKIEQKLLKLGLTWDKNEEESGTSRRGKVSFPSPSMKEQLCVSGGREKENIALHKCQNGLLIVRLMFFQTALFSLMFSHLSLCALFCSFCPAWPLSPPLLLSFSLLPIILSTTKTRRDRAEEVRL